MLTVLDYKANYIKVVEGSENMWPEESMTAYDWCQYSRRLRRTNAL